MTAKRLYGMAAGAVVGGAPFWFMASVRTGGRWPGWVLTAVAMAISASAGRTPVAWACGVLVGALASWAALSLLVGFDWRVLPYVVVSFGAYFFVCAALVFARYRWTSARRPKLSSE